MVKIGQNDFNKTMDSYISDIRIKEEVETKKKKADQVKKEDIDFETYEESQDKPPNLGALFRGFFTKKEKEEIQKDIEELKELEEEEKELEEERESLLGKLTKIFIFRRKNVSEEDFEDGQELYDSKKESQIHSDIKEDIKRLGTIIHDLTRQLDSKSFKSFKLSEDFVDYKEIMQKHGLIKTKY